MMIAVARRRTKVRTVAILETCLYFWSSGGGGLEGLSLIFLTMADTFQKFGIANITPER